MDRYRESYERRLRNLDEILHQISCMDQAEDEAQLAEVIPYILKAIGEYTKADRVYIFDWIKEHNSFQNTFEWCAEGIRPQIQNLQYIPLEKMPKWLHEFQKKKNIVIYNVEDIAEKMPQEYIILKPQGIHALIAVPVYTNRILTGFIGVDNPKLSQNAMAVHLLSDVGGHLGAVRENLRMVKALEKEHISLEKSLKELQEQKVQLEQALERVRKNSETENKYKRKLLNNNRVLSGLSLDYTIAFVLNLDTDDYSIAFNQKTNHAKIMNNISKFKDYVEGYTENFVLSHLREDMKRELSSEVIKQRFEQEDDYHFSFETVPNAAGLSCFQAHIVKEYEGNDHYAFLGFRSVDEVVKQERYYKEALQTANQALKQQLDMITFALPGGVKISNDDPVYSFKYVSEQFAHMLGYDTPAELMVASGGSIAGLAHPDDLENGISEALDQYSRADHYEITYRMKCKDGSYKYIEDRGHKFRNTEGIVEHWNLILDQNELVEKTIALESEKKANQAKSDFLSRMSHDMRTPLNGIIGLLDICIRHPDDRKLVDASRLKARVAAEHLLSLINDTLELSKLENKDIPLDKEVFYAPALFHEVETIANMRADEGNVTIFYQEDIDDLPYPYLIGSPLHVKQILLNLIGNSIKYNKDQGSVYCYLKEQVISENKVTLEIRIQDTGIGMPQSFLKEIFKPFVQLDGGARSRYMGTGLGMAIVKNLLERMDGTIQIDSKEKIGTSINVSIPFEIAQNCSKKEETELPKADLEGIRVLLAEDNELNREIAVFVLEDEGIRVIEAVDGKQAVETFVNKPEYYFDAVLMDIMMPVMDGYEAARTIRSCQKADAQTIPIIAMTANAFDEDRRKAKEAGMNAHLAKPLNVPELMKTIRNLCNRKATGINAATV